MKKYDQPVEINHNPNWLYIPDNPYKILLLVVRDQAKLICVLELKTSTTRY